MPNPDDRIVTVSAANCTNMNEFLAMSEEEFRAAFEEALESMTYEQRSEYLRILEDLYGEGEAHA